MRPAGYAMSETAGEKNRRKRKYHTTAESIGKRLVMAELLRLGFEAELAGSSCKNHDMLVWVRDSPPKPIQRAKGVSRQRLHMHGVEEASAGQMRQPPRVITIGLMGRQRFERLIGLPSKALRDRSLIPNCD
jgi:hypothetical protein